MLEAKFEFIKKNFFLIAQVDEQTGHQKLVMQKINLNTREVIIEDSIDCIHVAITSLPIEEFEQRTADVESTEDFVKDLLYIRSSEDLKEINLSPKERFLAFKSWVQGIAEAGMDAFQVQSELEQAGNLMYPISNVLMRFIVKAMPDFLPFYLDKIKQDSYYHDTIYTSTLIANVDPIIQMLAQGAIEPQHLDYIIKKILKIGIPNSYFLDNNYFSKLIAEAQDKKIHDKYIDLIDKVVIRSGILTELDFKERYLIYLLVLNAGYSITDFIEHFEEVAKRKFRIANQHITKLFLNSHDFLNFSDLFEEIDSLEELYCTESNLQNLPESIGNLKNLKILWMGSNPFTSLPDSIGNLTSLKDLNLYNSRLHSLPNSFGNLKSLEILNLGHNRLTFIPSTIGRLNSLKEFHIIANEIVDLPDSIGELSSLEVFDLQMNELQSLSNSIGSLSNLKDLRLNQNKLKSLPDSIGDLSSLKTLEIQNNNIKNLPKNIVKLKSLRALNIRNNPFEIPEIIKNWLDSLKTSGCKVYD